MKKTKKEIAEYINTLKGYRGYIQYSNKPLDKVSDIFRADNPYTKIDEDGFIYEAHFCNGSQSIAIKQINDSWYVDETDISHIDLDEKNNPDIQTYISDIKDLPKIKMAQIWEEKADALCEGMSVKKLKKVVFVGFEKGEMR